LCFFSSEIIRLNVVVVVVVVVNISTKTKSLGNILLLLLLFLALLLPTTICRVLDSLGVISTRDNIVSLAERYIYVLMRTMEKLSSFSYCCCYEKKMSEKKMENQS
jgi:hypothetical protein